MLHLAVSCDHGTWAVHLKPNGAFNLLSMGQGAEPGCRDALQAVLSPCWYMQFTLPFDTCEFGSSRHPAGSTTQESADSVSSLPTIWTPLGRMSSPQLTSSGLWASNTCSIAKGNSRCT